MPVNAENTTSPIEIARRVIQIENDALNTLSQNIDKQFTAACDAILNSSGRLIITGMGKSGHISNKIAATMASTGTPAYFVHPGEALHGDLGMIKSEDVVIAISNSGSTEELLVLANATTRQGTTLIAMTGNASSQLASIADIHLSIAIKEEACPMGLAPTSSTTVTLVLGDALAVALLEARGFTPEDFARSHPAGRLGKRLLVRVQDIMHTGDALPIVSSDTPIRQTILEITSKKLGVAMIADEANKLLGIFTDGDLRRAFEKTVDMEDSVQSVQTTCQHFCAPDALAVDALTLMQSKEITVLPVVDNKRQIQGIIHMHDLLKAGIV